MKQCFCFFTFMVLLSAKPGLSQDWKKLALPLESDKWVQPAQDTPAQPVWGHRHGLRVGLAPLPGPRGLIRIYTPYLDQKDDRIMNFLALEPIIRGSGLRSFSELEMSSLDKKRGKRFWSANDSLTIDPQSESKPASGVIGTENGIETLTLYVFSETFESGAHVFVRLRFYENNPYEVEVKAFNVAGSAPVDYFIVTATMGNFARLRYLYLKDRRISSHELWPDYKENAFTDHAHFPLSDFIKSPDGNAYFIATPDEANPVTAKYDPTTVTHWKYTGKKGVQYWKTGQFEHRTEGLVNGRYTYWASQSPIPNGISFENFELKTPFEQGQTMTFGISPLTPESFIKEIKHENK